MNGGVSALLGGDPQGSTSELRSLDFGLRNQEPVSTQYRARQY